MFQAILDMVTAGQSGDGGGSSQDVSGVGGSGRDEMPPMDFHQTGIGTFHHLIPHKLRE